MDNSFVKELKKLKKIKPEKDWVINTKASITKEKPFSYFLFVKPVLGSVFALTLVLYGVFSISQNALPGEVLFSVKKLGEKSQGFFISQDRISEYQIKLAEKRLEELERIVQKSDTRKLSSALSEFKAQKEQVVQETKNNSEKSEEIMVQLQEISEREERVLAALGIQVGEPVAPPEKALAEYLINDLSQRSLTESQQAVLEEAKEYFENSEYVLAFQKAQEAAEMIPAEEEEETDIAK